MRKSLTILTLILLSLFTCCEMDEHHLELKSETQDSSIVIENVDFESIPNVINTINNVTSKSLMIWSKNVSKEPSGYYIDDTKILLAQDSVGNLSYSIRLQSIDISPNTFYNLIVTERTDDEYIAPFVIEYKFDNGDVYTYSEDKNKIFDGKVNIYSLEEFSTVARLNAKESKPVACFQDVGENNNTIAGSTNSSSGASSGGTSSNSGNSSKSSSISYGRTHISVGRTGRSRGSVSVGVGTL